MASILQDTRGALVAARKSSLNANSNAVYEHRKSKSSTFDDVTTSPVFFDAVILANSSISKPFRFFPITTILRAHLPLSWLSSSVAHILRPGSILRAHITTVSRWEYHILVAQLECNGVLFSLERVEADAYICYPLQNWVDIERVKSAAIGAARPIDLSLLLESRSDNSHSRRPSGTSIVNLAETSTPNSPKIPKNRRGHLARLSILETREKTEEPANIADVDELPKYSTETLDQGHEENVQGLGHFFEDNTTTLIQISTPLAHADEQPCANAIRASPTDQLSEEVKAVDHLSPEYLRGQYLETLYISKTSLAFYAKGPLSRARARTRMPKPTCTPVDLVNFYKECIIPTKKLDLKYKESLPNKISSLARDLDEESTENASKKVRKSKRTKLGKDGLWPSEDDYISRWWKGQGHTSALHRTADSQPSELRKATSHLRTRETEMHIILILEILALEEREIPKQINLTSMPNPEVKVESIEGSDEPLVSKAPAIKKSRDLKVELDFLIDRLCIWQSIGLEDAAERLTSMHAPDSASQRLKDRLHDFCKDVVVPFYGGKLPDQCHTICSKLGGAEFSPHKSKKGTEKGLKKPTQETEDTPQRGSNKRKRQAIIGDGQSPMPHPTLLRSATLPMPANIRRETSERPMSRGAMQKSVSFSNREVDLVADARATAAKRRKLDLVAAQKRELDAAIETLKRPNRTTVAKSFMDDMERRANDTRPAVKKVEPVQIVATPKRGGTRRIPTDEYDLPPIPLSMPIHETSLVPSSTAKPRGLGVVSGNSRSSAMKRAVLSAIHDTPSKAMTELSTGDMDDYEGGVGGQPVCVGVPSSTLIASTPTTSRRRQDVNMDAAGTPMRMKKSLRAVLFTPIKRSEATIDQAFKDAPVIPEDAGKMMDRVMGSKTDIGEMSLYESLGWNDDYDL